MLIYLPTLLCLAASAACLVPAPQGPRLLVVTEDAVRLDDYSLLWRSLEARGYKVSHRSAQELEPPLQQHDSPTFDHLILFAPTSKAFPADISPQKLYAYVEQGRNVLVVLSPGVSDFWRDFGREFDVELDDRAHHVIDHFNYDQRLDDGTHTTLVIPLSGVPSPFLSLSTTTGPPILYRGIGHVAGRQPLLSSILHALPTSYSYDLGDAPSEEPYLAGSATSLVSSLQARNNARITFVGSLDLFTDAFATASVASIDGSRHEASGNVAFIKDLTSWTFHEAGVIRAENVRHSRAVDGESRSLYRVRDELVYTIDLSTLVDHVWRPFHADDVQLEFTMLDPHLRLPLVSTPSPIRSNSTRFSAHFRAPDRHGVFTARVDYRRRGWSSLDEKAVISVTPPRHDEYDRFIVGALAYYAGAFSVVGAAVAFVSVWTFQ